MLLPHRFLSSGAAAKVPLWQSMFVLFLAILGRYPFHLRLFILVNVFSIVLI